MVLLEEHILTDVGQWKHFPFSSATVDALAKAGIGRNVQRSPLDRYCLDDAATLAQHPARYRSMLAQDAFMSADNFDGLFNMIVRHVSTLVRFPGRFRLLLPLLRCRVIN